MIMTESSGYGQEKLMDPDPDPDPVCPQRFDPDPKPWLQV